MKKFLILVVFLVLGALTTHISAQIVMPQGLALTGQQWHYQGFFICQTDDPYAYLVVVDGQIPQIKTLAPLSRLNIQWPYGVRIYSCQPYMFANELCWYFNTSCGRYTTTGSSISEIAWNPELRRNCHYRSSSIAYVRFYDSRCSYRPCSHYREYYWDGKSHSLLRDVAKAVNDVAIITHGLRHIVNDFRTVKENNYRPAPRQYREYDRRPVHDYRREQPSRNLRNKASARPVYNSRSTSRGAPVVRPTNRGYRSVRDN